MEFPFSVAKLDALLDEAGVDVLLATSKENVQYLLGGYRSSFYTHFYTQRDAVGMSRYLPCLGYPKGLPDNAFYVGNPLERWQLEVEPVWIKNVQITCWHTEQTGAKAANYIRALGAAGGTIGIEASYMPADCLAAIERELPNAKIVNVTYLMHRLRAIKRPEELKLLREVSEQIVASMCATVRSAKPEMATREIADRLMHEEVQRGLSFEYCLAAAGPNWNRAPSDVRWEKGRTLSLDSGGNKNGYIGDMARMAVSGKPTALMDELLSEAKTIQEAARSVVKPGTTGAEIFAAVKRMLPNCPHRSEIIFNAHGMGLVQHEAPFLSNTGPIPYPGLDPKEEERPIEAGMVLSIETDILNREVGFVKIEDTIAVTENGFEAYGDTRRDWIAVED